MGVLCTLKTVILCFCGLEALYVHEGHGVSGVFGQHVISAYLVPILTGYLLIYYLH